MSEFRKVATFTGVSFDPDEAVGKATGDFEEYARGFWQDTGQPLRVVSVSSNLVATSIEGSDPSYCFVLTALVEDET